MGKTGLFSLLGVIGWLIAVGVLLTVQFASWATPGCRAPNENDLVACYTPDPPGVAACTDVAYQNPCNNAAAYIINNFPNGSVPASSGATTTTPDECYQKKVCAWALTPPPGRCAVLQTEPSPTAFYVANKTVENKAVQCPPP